MTAELLQELDDMETQRDEALFALTDALAEIERLQVELADARSPVLHRGTELKAVPLRTRGVTGLGAIDHADHAGGR